MKLEYIGHACFRLELDNGFAWVTDPYDGSIGLGRPSVSATVTTLSHGHFDHNCVKALDGAGRLLASAGEYEEQGVRFTLIHCYHDEERGARRGENLITVCEAEGVRLCHMGDIGHQPDAELLKQIGRIDILMLPVGGTYTLDGAGAAKAAAAIAARTVVPMHFNVPRLKLDIAGPEAFLEAMGGAYARAGSVLDVKSAPAGVVLMTPSR